MKLSDYEAAARRYPNMRIYSLHGRSLGRCLNLGVQLARYEYIAKFDDDDYYSRDFGQPLPFRRHPQQ